MPERLVIDRQQDRAGGTDPELGLEFLEKAKGGCRKFARTIDGFKFAAPALGRASVL
jgi:hypothetical protein